MKLITKQIQTKLDKAGWQGNKAICKFFNPMGAGTWIIFGQDEEEKDLLMCVADIGMDCVEAGSVLLSELETLKLPFGLGIERDLSFKGGKDMTHYLQQSTLAGCN